MQHSFPPRATAAFLFALLLTACGGGGGSGGTTLPGGPSTTPTPGSGGANAILTLTAPSVGQSARTRKPTYVPATLHAISVTVNGASVVSAEKFTCSGTSALTCSAEFAVPAGNDAFDIYLFGNSAKPLSHAAFSLTIAAGSTAALHPTFHGIVTSANITVSNLYPQVGTPTTLTVGVQAQDADGNLIAGDPFDTPIVVALTNASGHFSLQSTTLASPTDQISLSYDGHNAPIPPLLSIATQGVASSGAAIVPNAFQTFGPASSFVKSVAIGANGSIWFVGCAQGNSGPCHPGVLLNGTISEFSNVPWLSAAALGPDGNMWFSGGMENPYVYRVSSNGAESAFLVHSIGANEAYDSYAIVAGSDGNMWFTEGDHIGKISMSGSVTEFALDGYNRPQTLVPGPDGRLWFDDGASVGAITTTGAITYYPLQSGEAFTTGVAFASDGALHFFVTDMVANSGGGPPTILAGGMRTMTTSGVETQVNNNQLGGLPIPIVQGPDGNIWGPFPGGTFLTTPATSLTPILDDETPTGASTFFYSVPNSAATIGTNLVVGPDRSVWSGYIGANESIITRFIYNP